MLPQLSQSLLSDCHCNGPGYISTDHVRKKPVYVVFKYLFSQYIFSLFDELFLILLSTMHGNIYTDTITFAHTKVGLSLNISTKEIFYHMGTEIQL